MELLASLSMLGIAPDSVLAKILLVGLAMVLIPVLAIGTHIAYQLKFFFFPRKYQYPETYPFASTMLISRAVQENKVLEELLRIFKDVKEKFNRKSLIVNTLGNSHYAFTSSVENVTYILKGNFENFGKGGPEFKPKFQGFLGNGIFNADGQTWYAHRKTSALIFKLNRFKTSVSEIFHDDMDQAVQWIRSKGGQKFDFHALMHRYTLESIARIAFGFKLDVIMKERVQFSEDFDYCTCMINNAMVDPLWWFKRYFTPIGWKYFLALRRINAFTAKIIQDRRAQIETNGGQITADMNDLLSLYLDKGTFGEKTIGGGGGDEANYKSFGDTYLEPNDSTLRDVILNMVIAGRDTTAQALSWAFYRMCIHDGVQEKLREEVVKVLQDTGEYATLRANAGLGTIAYDTLQKMKYLEGFIMEVLRLHPSVPKEGKCVFKDDVLPDGTEVKVGDIVSFIPWCMGKDPDLWGKDCMEFKPERFIGKDSKPSPFVFIAFQAGPRTCLGQNFALLEMKTVIARLLTILSFTIAQDPSTITYENSLTLPMRGGMQMIAKEI
jgi:cytochrome P450